MKLSDKISRYKFYVQRKVDILLNGLSKSKLEGRRNGSKVILNSLPKSGTHLIETLFFALPQLRHYGGRTIMINTHDNSAESGFQRLKRIRKGQFVPAHIQYDLEISHFFRDNDFKVIQMIRDPRDVLISHLLYVREMDKTHKAHQFIHTFRSDVDQFKAIIDGEKDIIEPFAEVATKFSGWLKDEHVLVVRFEDLVGSRGGGSDAAQLKTVEKIADHVGLTLSSEELSALTNKIFSTKSSTFNTGRIGKWTSKFTAEHKKICKEKIQGILELYGYEEDNSW